MLVLPLDVAQPAGLQSLRFHALNRGKRKDVLFFTQELATLLNAGVPLDRALSIVAQLTNRGDFRVVVMDVMRILKGGSTTGNTLRR